MAKIDKRLKEYVCSMMRDDGKLTQERVIELMDTYCEKLNVEKIINQYKRARAGRFMASFKDKTGGRRYFSVKDKRTTIYVDIDDTKKVSFVEDVIGTLYKQRNGLEKSIQKAEKRKQVLEGQVTFEEMEVKENV